MIRRPPSRIRSAASTTLSETRSSPSLLRCSRVLPGCGQLNKPPRPLLLVQLDDPNRTVRGRVDAEVAEDALVEVLGDDFDAGVGRGEDVDGADFFELLGELGVGGDRGVDLDVDEDLVQRLGHQTAAPSFSLTASGISSIRSTTRMPAASRRAIFSVAVSSTPSTMVPA